MQLPEAVKVKTPVVEFMVHPVVPALTNEYEIVGEPSPLGSVDGVAGESEVTKVVVGAQVIVCAVRVTVKLMLLEVAISYVESAPIDAVKVQVPDVTNATTPEVGLIVQTDVVLLE